MNDGHSTGYFSLSSGTRQGDPISAFLFILVMEILFIQIRSNENIHGLKFFGYEFKLSAFADDVSYFLKDINSVKELLKLLEQSSQFTSLKVNYGKSEICGTSSKKGAIGAFSQFRIVKLMNDSVKILGCHHSYNSQLANDRNFCDTIKKDFKCIKFMANERFRVLHLFCRAIYNKLLEKNHRQTNLCPRRQNSRFRPRRNRMYI